MNKYRVKYIFPQPGDITEVEADAFNLWGGVADFHKSVKCRITFLWWTWEYNKFVKISTLSPVEQVALIKDE